jgi:hypothetical protein
MGIMSDIKQWLRVRAFMNAIHREVREGHNVVILYQYGFAGGARRQFTEMGDPAFRARCLKLLEGNPWVVCYRFSPPDSYDDWTFSAYPKPKKIDPGHCIVCNHAYVRNHRCENISCQAEQRLASAPVAIG